MVEVKNVNFRGIQIIEQPSEVGNQSQISDT
jgi:hypothetical protein